MNKIIVFGDSISYGKWDGDGGWAARLRKHVDQKYNIGKGGNRQVYNMGIPGELAIRMVDRVENELIPRIDETQKNLVIFAIGVNDSCPNNLIAKVQTPKDDFKKALTEMIVAVRDHACEVVVVGLAPVNPARSKGLLFSNEAVREYDTYLSEVCAEQGVPKIQLFDELMTAHFDELLVDSVHPNDEGHYILAAKIISFLELHNFLV